MRPAVCSGLRAEGHADCGNDDAEDPERDGIAGGPALGRGKEQRKQDDRAKFADGRARDRHLTENGVLRSAASLTTGTMSPRDVAASVMARKNGLRTHPTAWNAVPAAVPSSSEPAKPASGARSWLGLVLLKSISSPAQEEQKGPAEERQHIDRSNPGAVHDLRAHRGLAGGSPANGSP